MIRHSICKAPIIGKCSLAPQESKGLRIPVFGLYGTMVTMAEGSRA